MSTVHDAMLTETIARHFEDATTRDGAIDLGLADLWIQCAVDSVGELGGGRTASLYFNLWGGALGERPIFASITGYGASLEEAIISGGCNWACAFGPVLAAALADGPLGEADAFEVVHGGVRCRVVVDGLDRLPHHDDGDGDVVARARAARDHLGGAPWLVARVLGSGTLPPPAGRSRVAMPVS